MNFGGILRFLFGESNEKELDQQAGENTEDEYEIAAAITAAVYEYMKPSPGTRLEVVSIKRTGQTAPLWNRAGRLDHISRKL